jgi:SpoVK/Ycf46/Vps4 family AAA+-type ATPase
VFIDEVDQMFAARSASAGHYGDQVEARLLGRLLEFMGNPSHRGDILWVGATNRPDLMDVATLRRFDRVFAFMNPSDEARAALVGDLLRKLGVPHAADFDCGAAAQLMADFSCDEVEKVIRRAYELCVTDREAAVTNQHVNRARASFKHNYDPLMHELVALLSVQGSNFVCDLPWYDNDGKLIAPEHLPPFLSGLVDDDGTLDLRRIGQRAEELRAIMRSR